MTKPTFTKRGISHEQEYHVPNIDSKLFSETELQAILKEFHYEDKARKCTVSTLISCFVTAPANEWKSLRHSADVGPSAGLVSVDYSTLSKHMKSLDYFIIKRIFEVIIGRLNRAA